MASREQTQAMIEVMQAYVDGKEIEYWSAAKKEWRSDFFGNTPSWGWSQDRYRVKPIPCEWWIASGSGHAFRSLECAMAFLKSCGRVYEPIIHVMEVLE